MESRPQNPTAEQLLHADEYTPEELSELTGVGLEVIRRAAYDGELVALIVDNDIIKVSRADALHWLTQRAAVVSKETP